MQNWEIHDDSGLRSKGTYEDIIHIWNTTCLTDWAYKEMYGRKRRKL